MAATSTLAILVFGTAAGLYLLFLRWYDGLPRRPVSPAETDRYLEYYKSRRQPAATDMTLARFEEFLRTDDGREFYMVNLIRYNPVAPGEKSGSQSKAHRAYLKAWARVARRRASHRIYSGAPIVKLFGKPEDEKWDTIALMRYRSRRDLLQIVTDPQFAKDAALKGASVAYTDVYPSSVENFTGNVRRTVFLALFAIALLASMAAQWVVAA